MAASNYQNCLKRVLVHEGGYANHPKDPGGATMRGVTQRVYDAYRKARHQATRSVRQITDEELQAIYRRDYWAKVAGDGLPPGLDYATFDAGVNSGPSRGVKWLQKALGVRQDGEPGPATLKAARAADGRRAVKAACAARLSFLRGLGTWSTFGRGWASRVAGVEAAAVAMVLSASGMAPAKVASELKADGDNAQAASANQRDSATATAAASGLSGGAGAPQVEWAWHALAPWVVGGTVVLLLVVAAVLWHRSRVNDERASAYARAAREAVDG